MMLAPADAAVDPLAGKLVLAAFGALAGWALKAAWDELTLRRRWRRLAPLVLRQVAIAASDCAKAFDTLGLPRAVARLAAAQASATELVASGVGAHDWLRGIELIVDTLDAAQAAQAAPAAQAGAALLALRNCAGGLVGWIGTMR